MARKAKKLQELQTMFNENDIDFSKVKEHSAVVTREYFLTTNIKCCRHKKRTV